MTFSFTSKKTNHTDMKVSSKNGASAMRETCTYTSGAGKGLRVWIAVSVTLIALLGVLGSSASSAFALNLPEAVVLPTVSPAVPHLEKAESGTTGSWAHGPTSLSYTWERCNVKGSECKEIAGATAASYTPVEADVEHTLRLKVTAKNSEGSNSGYSSATQELQPRGKATEYAIAPAYGITAGPDGNLWIASGGNIKKVTTSGVVANTYPLPGKNQANYGITSGPDGNMWFTTTENKIGKITTAGAISEYVLPAGSEPIDIAGSVKDATLWFTDHGSCKIGKITTSGVVTEYALPVGSEPWAIAAGPSETMWFTERGTSKIGKITASGTITEYALPAGSEPRGITPGANEELWFTAYGTSKVGKITTSGVITEYALPAESHPEPIVTGPEGDLWLVEKSARKVAVVTTGGAVTEYSIAKGSLPRLFTGITVGPDDNVWFTTEENMGVFNT